MRKNKDLFSIFPADAGVNLMALLLRGKKKNIPRGCGGEPNGVIAKREKEKYSPRMRG